MTFEIVEKEMSSGSVAGSDYGAAVRVIMRSPTHVMFSALGIQLWDRNIHGGWHHLKTLIRKRPSRAVYAEIAEKIDEVFGAGAAKMLIEGSRKSQTVLVDGGGAAMPLPRVQFIAKLDAAHRTVSPDWRADLTGRIKTCKQCGKNLQPCTDHHRLGFQIKDGHPKSTADCQLLTNQEVIAVHGFDTRFPDKWEYVEWFETWNGENYLDEDFCNNTCAAEYGRRAARALDPLPIGGEVPRTPHRIRDNTDHFEKVTQEVEFQGRKIKI